jgi:hypothetical protein
LPAKKALFFSIKIPFDGQRVALETRQAGSSSEMHFVYGNYIDEVLFSNKFGVYWWCKYYIHDHLFSPVTLIWYSTGIVQERYEYDSYGKPTIWNANLSGTRSYSNYGNNYLFTGREVDILDNGSLKIQNNRNRSYD